MSRRTLLLAALATSVGSRFAGAAGEPKEIRIDWATYNPVSMVLKEQGLLEKEFAGDGIAIRWVQTLGSNKALEFLNAGSIDFGSTAGAAALIGKLRSGAIGFEADLTTVSTASQMRELTPKRIRWKETTGLIMRQRIIKDAEELKLIRAAVKLGAKVYLDALESLRPGISEVEVAARLEYAARQGGADAMSFETIVAAGKRGALPHGRASSASVPKRGLVVIDSGVILRGYCSDMTRTVHVGRVGRVEREWYKAVLDAQLAGISAVRPGATAGEVDAASRSLLHKAKLDRYFTHSTGHGVGLEIHEPPRLGKAQPETLQPGMVITIEPGIYVPGKGGIRIEDMVVVTSRGADVLTPVTKELIEL